MVLYARTVAWVVAVGVVTAVAGCSGGDKGSTEQKAEGTTEKPVANRVVMKTNKGDIEIELFPDKAPKTVENFLRYVDEGFYEGTIFHRVIKDFMIQGGGYDTDLQRKATHEPIPNEASNGLKNETGTIAMARTSAPHSATSQFFINVKDNQFLDFKSETPQGWGYTVFGKVVDGMDVVRQIEQTPTEDKGGAFRDLPKDPIIIESIERK